MDGWRRQRLELEALNIAHGPYGAAGKGKGEGKGKDKNGKGKGTDGKDKRMDGAQGKGKTSSHQGYKQLNARWPKR